MKTKKSLGQHFLHSPKIISDIVKTSGTKTDDIVLEIGPGEGILTFELLQTGAKVIAIEKDDRLIPILQEKFSKEIVSKQFVLIRADILNIPMSRMPFDIKKYKVVANIPYYITGQIIRKFLESAYQPESMTLLVQKEVAERIVAKNGKESLLSLGVKVFGEPKLVRIVGRGAFSPKPNVDSAILYVREISKKRLDSVNEKFFFTILHTGFAHKRKQFLSNLTSLYNKETLLKTFKTCEINTKSRAEDLTLLTWIKLCKNLKTSIR